jgi:hypothetical protein
MKNERRGIEKSRTHNKKTTTHTSRVTKKERKKESETDYDDYLFLYIKA